VQWRQGEYWLRDAVKYIKFPPDRRQVRQELYEHMIARNRDFLAEGYSEQEADRLSCEAMGDSAEVGKALAAVHKGRPVEGLSPCGACRQVMMQAEERYGRPLRTLLCGGRETVAVGSVRDLLPLWGGMPLETVPAGNAGKPGQMQEG